MPTETLHDLPAFERAVAGTPRVVLFKHSPICPVSVRALGEWRAFEAAHPALPKLFVDVIGDRPVARGLAAACGVPHESPQAILFVEGQAAWDASHGAITAPALERACREHGAL